MLPSDNPISGIQHPASGSDPLPVYLFSKTSHPGVIHIPILRTAHLKPKIDFDAYDGIIITSKEAVDALDALGGAWKRLPLLCVGTKTAEHARRHGGTLLECANGYGDELEALVLERYAHQRWLYARPRKAASDFAARLREAGAVVEDAVVYETSCNESVQFTIEEDAVLAFTSPSAVSCFLRRCVFKPTHRIVVIGATTAAALPEGVDAQMPPSPSVEALVKLGKKIAWQGGGF